MDNFIICIRIRFHIAVICWVDESLISVDVHRLVTDVIPGVTTASATETVFTDVIKFPCLHARWRMLAQTTTNGHQDLSNLHIVLTNNCSVNFVQRMVNGRCNQGLYGYKLSEYVIVVFIIFIASETLQTSVSLLQTTSEGVTVTGFGKPFYIAVNTRRFLHRWRGD